MSEQNKESRSAAPSLMKSPGNAPTNELNAKKEAFNFREIYPEINLEDNSKWKPDSFKTATANARYIAEPVGFIAILRKAIILTMIDNMKNKNFLLTVVETEYGSLTFKTVMTKETYITTIYIDQSRVFKYVYTETALGSEDVAKKYIMTNSKNIDNRISTVMVREYFNKNGQAKQISDYVESWKTKDIPAIVVDMPGVKAVFVYSPFAVKVAIHNEKGCIFNIEAVNIEDMREFIPTIDHYKTIVPYIIAKLYLSGSLSPNRFPKVSPGV